MSFLPKDYELPQAESGYMKFRDGSNRFRIISEAITGWEYWTEDKKPVRSPKRFATTPNIKLNQDGTPSRPKHFWACVVWDYQSASLKILEITQASVQSAMKIKIDNRAGDYQGYDFIVTRTGEGFDTDYDVDTGDKTPLDPKILELYKVSTFNLPALYTGDDPFKPATVVKEDDIANIMDGVPF